MSDAVQRMLEQLNAGDDAPAPPLDQWHPDLSGAIDIRIASDGRWYHEGGVISRAPLVKLFASILRFEKDCGYVLVTPVEKWQIQVEDAPFIAVAVSRRKSEQGEDLHFVSNVGEEVFADADHPIVLDGDSDNPKPSIVLREGLRARLSRPVYYELARAAVACDGLQGVWSGGLFFPLEMQAAQP